MSLQNDPQSGTIGRKVFNSLNHLIATFEDYPQGEDNAPYDIDHLRKSQIQYHDKQVKDYNDAYHRDVYKSLETGWKTKDSKEIKKATEKLNALKNSKLIHKNIKVLLEKCNTEDQKLTYQRLEYIFFANTPNNYIEDLYIALKNIKKINQEALAALEKFYSKDEKLEKTAYLKTIFRKLDRAESRYQFITPILQTGFSLIQGPLQLLSVPLTFAKPYFCQLSARAIHRLWPNYLPFKVYDNYKKFLEEESSKVEEQKKLLMKYGLAQLEIISKDTKLSCEALIRKINDDLKHLQGFEAIKKFEKVEEFCISPYLFCKFHKQILAFLSKQQNNVNLEAKDIKERYEKLSWFNKKLEIPINLELKKHQLVIIPHPKDNSQTFQASLRAASTVYYCGPQLWDIVQYNFAMEKIKRWTRDDGFIKVVGQEEKKLIECFESAIAALTQMKLSVETPHQDTDSTPREVWKSTIEKKLQKMCKTGQSLLSWLEEHFTSQIKTFPLEILVPIKKLLALKSPQKSLIDVLSKLQLEVRLNLDELKVAFEKLHRKSFKEFTTALQNYKTATIEESPDVEKIAQFCYHSLTDLNKGLHLKAIMDFLFKKNVPTNYEVLQTASKNLWGSEAQTMLNSLVECYLDSEDDPESPYLKIILEHCPGAIKAWIESYRSTFDHEKKVIHHYLSYYFNSPRQELKPIDETLLKKIRRWKLFAKMDSNLTKLSELSEEIQKNLETREPTYIHDHLGKVLLELGINTLIYVYGEKFISFHLENFPDTFHHQTIFLQQILPYQEVKEKIKNIAFNWAQDSSKINNPHILDSLLLCLDDAQKEIVLKNYAVYAQSEIDKIHLETLEEYEGHVLYSNLPVTEGLQIEVDKLLKLYFDEPGISLRPFLISERFASPKTQYLFRLKALNAFVENDEPTEIDKHLEELKISFALSHLHFGQENLSVVLDEMDNLLNLWREGKLQIHQKNFLNHFFAASPFNEFLNHPEDIIKRYKDLSAIYGGLTNPFSPDERKLLKQIVTGDPLLVIELWTNLKSKYLDLPSPDKIILYVEKGFVEALYKLPEKSIEVLANHLQVKFLGQLSPKANIETLSFLLNNSRKLKDFITVIEESFSGLFDAKMEKIERAITLISKLKADNRYLYLPYLPVVLKTHMHHLFDELTTYTSNEIVGDLMIAFKTFLKTGDLDPLSGPLKKYQEWLAKQDQ